MLTQTDKPCFILYVYELYASNFRSGYQVWYVYVYVYQLICSDSFI